MTADVRAFRLLPDKSVLQSFVNDDSGQTVDGPEKLGQRVILHLMTPKGSILGRPNIGSKFIPQLRDGRVQTELDVFTAFAAAMLEITPTIQNEEQPNDPPEERFRAAIIQNILIGRGNVSLNISIKNRAGKLIGLTLPLNFTF